MDATTLESTSTVRWGARFRTTRWSLVLAAASGGDEAQAALGELYRAYFHPLVALLARHRGRENAAELTQAFFVKHLLDEQHLKKVERRPGKRFRGWLSRALRTFMMDQWRYERRERRDVRRNVALGHEGDEHTYPVTLLVAPRSDLEWQTERGRALTLLVDTIDLLEREYCQRARASGVDGPRRFEVAKRAFLPGADYRMISLEQCATELQLSLDATKKLVSRLRKRYLVLRDRELCRRVSRDLPKAKRWLSLALEPPSHEA